MKQNNNVCDLKSLSVKKSFDMHMKNIMMNENIRGVKEKQLFLEEKILINGMAY